MPHLVLDRPRGQIMHQIFNQIEKEHGSRAYGRELNLRFHFIILLIQMQRIFMDDINKNGDIKSLALVRLFRKNGLPRLPYTESTRLPRR